MSSDAGKHFPWKKEDPKTTMAALEMQIQVRERLALVEGQNISARNLMQGFLNDFPLTGEMVKVLKSVLKVLNPDADEFTTKKGRKTQETQTPLDSEDVIPLAQNGSSLDFSNSSVAQNDLDIPASTIEGNKEKEAVQMKRPLNSALKTVPKITGKHRTTNKAKKHSGKATSNFTPNWNSTPLKIGEPSTANALPRNQRAHPLLSTSALYGNNSGLPSSSITPIPQMSNTTFSSDEKICASRKTTVRANPQVATAGAQSGTSHLAKNGNKKVSEISSLITTTNRTRKQDAVDFFCNSLQKNVKRDGVAKAVIEKLCLRLKLDPVALKLAVSYINEDLLVLPNPNISEVIKNYFSRIPDETVRSHGKLPEIVQKPSYLTWRVTNEKIRKTPEIGERALKFMHIISLLAADNIETKFVWDLYSLIENQKDDSTIREKILQLLKRFSVINSSSGESISIHPVLQEAIRIHLEEQKNEKVLDKIQKCAHKMIQENDVTSQEMSHIKSIWEHATKRTAVIKEDGRFPSSICRELIQLGKYNEAFNFSCRVLPVLESTLGGKSRWTLALKFWKGCAMEELGEYSKSLELLAEVYEEQKELFGEEDKDCLDTATEIGRVHWRLEKYDEALQWNRSALEKRERIFGKEHSATLTLKNGIAVVLEKQGKYKQAMDMHQQILLVQEKVRGKEHRETLTTKHNMAAVTFRQGKFKDALKMFQEVLQTRERILEVNHPRILGTKALIADTYTCLGRNDEAVKLYKEVLDKSEKIFGTEHPQILITKHSLAITTFRQGEYEDALKLFQEILELQERVLGLDHPNTLTTKKWIAEAYEVLGRDEETDPLQKRK